MLFKKRMNTKEISFNEEVQIIRTKIIHAQEKQPIKSIVVTSPMPGDGKTTLAISLAKSIAHTGKSVVYIDANLNSKTNDAALKLTSNGDYGLSDYLNSVNDLSYLQVLSTTEISNLSVIPNYVISNHEDDLLSGRRFLDLITLLKEKFDFLIFDSAEIVDCPDTMFLVGQADSVILIARLKHTLKSLTTRAIRLLQELDVNVIGWVLNKS